MNTNQYTQKTLEALQAAQQLAVEYQHNALEPEHLLHALASQEQGLIPQLLQKLNVDPGSFAAAVAEKLSDPDQPVSLKLPPALQKSLCNFQTSFPFWQCSP